MTTLIFLPILLGFGIAWLLRKKRLDEPPGPFQWPILGNVLDLYFANSKYPHLALQKISDKYGSVISLKLGMHKMVVLSSYEVIKEYMTKEELSDKYVYQFAKDRGYGKPLGIVHSSGEAWSTLRRFTMKSLKGIGFGNKDLMEDIIRSEISELLLEIDQKCKLNNGILHMDNFFARSSVNIIWRFVTGERYSTNDAKLQRMIQMNKRYTKSVSLDRLTVLFPTLRYFLPGFAEMKAAMTDLQNFAKEIVNSKKDGRKELPENFINTFLLEIEKNEHAVFNEEELVVILLDLFIGGTETSSNMLSFGILFMLINREVQIRVQNEIDQQASNKLSFNDLKRMPFTHATILEIFRLALLIPVPFGRVAKNDCIIGGFHVPKGTCITYNLNSVQMDTKFWKDPQSFRPQRFLTTDLKIIHEERVPVFGFGKRICPAEAMARTSFFLFFAAILRKYDFLPVSQENLPSTYPRPSANAQAPQPFTVLVRQR